MLSASCHCGAFQFSVPRCPKTLTNCNCSICRRIGGLWAYCKVADFKMVGHPANTAEYIWGDKTLRIVRCKTYGVTTHWEPLVVKSDSKMGVNAKNFAPEKLGDVRVKPFDGASTWRFLD